MLVPMAKVEIIGPKNLFFEVVERIHADGRLDIEDLTERISHAEIPVDRMEASGGESDIADALDAQQLRVRAILSALHAPAGGVSKARIGSEYDRLWKLERVDLAPEVERVIADMEGRVAGLAAKKTAAESEATVLARYEPILGKIQPLANQLVATGGFDSVALLIDKRYRAGLEQLKVELERITSSQCEMVTAEADENTTAAIVIYSRKYADAVHKFLAVENVNQVRLPQDFQDVPLDTAFSMIRERRLSLPAEIEEIKTEIADLSERWYEKLVAVRDVLADRLEEIAVIPKFGHTDFAFVIDGWLPANEFQAFEKLIRTYFGDEVIVAKVEVTDRDMEDAPVALRNPKWAKPFESLLSYMGMPQYGTFDPTWMLAVFYPLFFGMIVGDMGYGLIMLATVIWMRRKFSDSEGIKIATAVLGPAATSATLFGFIYGEFFGNLLGPKFMDLIKPLYVVSGKLVLTGSLHDTPSGGTLLLPFERTSSEMMMTLLFISLGVGLFQVLLGLGIGVYNGIRTGHKSHVFEKGGIFAFVVGFLILVAGVVGGSALLSPGAKPWVQALGAVVLIGGIFFAFKGGSILGIVESIGALANIASYLRIMAVGLAGAIFAEAVNGIAANMGNPVLGVLVAAPLQALNFIIAAAFSPNIHAVRLNFLEFFGKFYEPSERKYEPFHKSGEEKTDDQ